MAAPYEQSEEFKNYLQNLGTEYRFACLHEKNAEGCHLLGQYFESAKLDYKKAATLYKSTCDDYKYPLSCFKYASFSVLGRGCEESLPKAFEYFKKGCELNHPTSCLHGGLMLNTKKGDLKVEGSPVEGLGYLKKACDAKNQMGCFFVSGVYISGAEGIPKDMVKAFEYSMKACELGSIYACANLSKMYKKGEGVEKNEKLSAEYKNKAKMMKKELKGKVIDFEQYT